MGVREYGCNLKTTASNFETGLICESYSPNMYGAGDVGRYPIEIEAKCRMLGFWYSLCNTSNSKSPKISNLMFQLCSKLHCACQCILLWLMEMHSLLDSLGLSYIWSNQVHSIKSFNRIVRQRSRDQFGKNGKAE